MEPSSKIYGDGTEEYCQSSESGWTMYIGSSMDEYYDGSGGNGVIYDVVGSRKKKGVTVKDEDDDTDDSMASDASSGPSHLHMVQEQDNNISQEKCKSISKKNKKTSGKKKVGYDQETRKKDESLVNEKRGHVVTTVQSGNRGWFSGKRK